LATANGTAPSRGASVLAVRWSVDLALHRAAILFSDRIEGESFEFLVVPPAEDIWAGGTLCVRNWNYWVE
jgi:hypothetical protein